MFEQLLANMHWGVVAIVIQLIFLECILSIDNAAVLGAMVNHLPTDKPTPWPKALKPFFGWTDKFMGSQRSAALKVGLFGAYAGRLIMLALATIIVRNPWMQILGALYLLHLGIQHFIHLYHEEQHATGHSEGPMPNKGGFWSVVLALNLADMAFSLDNVIAAVALSDKFWVVALGVGVGIVMMRFAATLFARMIAWEPKLESGAYLLLLAIGSELILAKILDIHIDDMVSFAISVMIILLTITFARVTFLRPLLIVFRPGVIAAVTVNTLVGRAFGSIKKLVVAER